MTATTTRQPADLIAGLPEGRPPIERWDPPLRGDSDMRITADGRWFHQGSEIKRERMVRLFSHILRREGETHVLVTPVEKLTIAVEDTPLIAAEVDVEGSGEGQTLRARLNNGDEYAVSKRFPIGMRADGAPVLYLDRGLAARLSRPAWYTVAALVEADAAGRAGVRSHGDFLPLDNGA
ncbi:MAG: DUF1285 domain-containing protein [Pacificimonas sp.]|jgi:hypothetical protein|nr:DUF1285 domain-containing protein [Pacificimonas sp.]